MSAGPAAIAGRGRGRPRWPLLLLGAVITVAALTLQDAGDGGPLPALVGTLRRLLPWAIVLVGAAEGAARLLGSNLRGLSHLAWDGGAGVAALIALVVALGQLPGLFSPPAAWSLLLALVPWALGSRLWRHGQVDARPEVSVDLEGAADHGSDRHLPATVAWVAATVTLAGLLWSRVPPVFYDTLAYHFAQPSLWLLEGRLQPFQWSLMSWFPPGVSALYGLGLAWAGDAGAADGNVVLALLALLLTADLSNRLGGSVAARAAVLIFAGLPLVIHALAIPAADLGHGLLGFGALACWLAARRDAGGPWAARSALLAGGALLTKYLGVMVPLLPVFVLWTLAPPAGTRRRVPDWRQGLLVAALPLAMATPWLAANLYVTGNPVAPMLSGLLPVPAMAPGAADAFGSDARAGLPRTEDLGRLPHQLLLGDPATTVYPSPAWGWMPLLLAAVWLAWRPPARDAALVALLTGIQFVAWLLSARWERFLVSASLTGAVLLALMSAALWRRGAPQRGLLAVVAAVGLLGMIRAGSSIQGFTGGLSVAIGAESPAAFRKRVLPFNDLYDRAGALLDPARDRLLLLGESRHHGLGVPHAAPTPFNRHPLVELLGAGVGPAAVRGRLLEAGYTHLVVDAPQVARSAARYPSLRLLAERPELLADLLNHLGRPLWQSGHAAIWNLREPPQESAE